jgi:hypothetical protein
MRSPGATFTKLCGMKTGSLENSETIEQSDRFVLKKRTILRTGIRIRTTVHGPIQPDAVSLGVECSPP